jgi:hypothetical protein
VVVINEALAKRFWKSSPIGRRVNASFADPKVWSTIVGVVENTKNAGMDKPAGPELYLQAHQVASFYLGTNLNFVVRTGGDPQTLANGVRAAVREIDPSLPVYGLRPMSEVVERSMVQPRFLSLLLVVFQHRLVPGSDWYLWRDGVFGESTDTGDWCAHGVGRAAIACLAAGVWAGFDFAGDWHGHRPGWSIRANALAAELAL